MALSARQAERSLEAGFTESPRRRRADGLAVMGWMDEVPRRVGVHDPGE